jgi:hypothetical protein
MEGQGRCLETSGWQTTGRLVGRRGMDGRGVSDDARSGIDRLFPQLRTQGLSIRSPGTQNHEMVQITRAVRGASRNCSSAPWSRETPRTAVWNVLSWP